MRANIQGTRCCWSALGQRSVFWVATLVKDLRRGEYFKQLTR